MRRFIIKILLVVSLVSFAGISSFNGGVVVQAQTVYYTPKGKSIHFNRDCARLANSNTVYSGEFEQVKSIKSDICDVCGQVGSSSTEHNVIVEENVWEVTINSGKINEYLKNAYKQAFNREIDNDGLSYWYDQIFRGIASVQDFTINIIDTEEFKGLNLDPKETINRLYKVMFAREADSSGLDYWVGVYNKNCEINKEDALKNTVLEMMKSDEFIELANSVRSEKHTVS